MEHQLTYSQRKLVRSAHSSIRIYDLGYKRNYLQVFGDGPLWQRLWYGGIAAGDGATFPRNPEAEHQLEELALALRREGREEDY